MVSLTTYEPRWHNVHYTIESIGCGRLRPSRLVLWIAPSVLQAGTPETLRRLSARGLEIRTCDDLGPHKKYYPQVMEGAAQRDLVTADDDVLYGAGLAFDPGCGCRRQAGVHPCAPCGGDELRGRRQLSALPQVAGLPLDGAKPAALRHRRRRGALSARDAGGAAHCRRWL